MAGCRAEEFYILHFSDVWVFTQPRSLADKPSRAKIHLCPLWSNSGHCAIHFGTTTWCDHRSAPMLRYVFSELANRRRIQRTVAKVAPPTSQKRTIGTKIIVHTVSVSSPSLPNRSRISFRGDIRMLL